MKAVSKSLAETQKLASEFVQKFLDPKKEVQKSATVIGLSGDLGAGKTTFMKSVAEAFGVTEAITSPTYVIEKIFELTNQPFKHLIHIDAYRLENSSELLNLGWRETIADPKNIIFIEWPEKVSDILPADTQTIYFKFIDETAREIIFP